jgi:hypothetical protein
MEQIGEERWDRDGINGGWGAQEMIYLLFLLFHWIFQLTLMSFLSVLVYTCCPLTNSCQVVQVPRWEGGRAPPFSKYSVLLEGMVV